MYGDEENFEANGEINSELGNRSNNEFYSELSSELIGESLSETEDETPKWIPRKIIFGFVIVCLGIAIMLYNFDFFRVKDTLWFLPFVLVVTGLLRIWKKGFFNVLAQILIIGGLQLHLFLLGHRRVISLGLPVLVIWVGILIVIKGFLPHKGTPKYRRFSDFKIKMQQEQNVGTDMTSAITEPENTEQIQ
ncbi:MAG: hypothetical protein LBB40_03610 [Holophagales bacterium]|jgi:predicted membrane protein|nr:hypothetical protein [Holophagales bacterium]